MFLMKAPSGAITSITARVSSHGWRILISSRLKGSSAPERSMPRLSANIAATVTVASLLNPDKRFERGDDAQDHQRRQESSAQPDRCAPFSLANSAIAITITATVAHACQVTRAPALPPWTCA